MNTLTGSRTRLAFTSLALILLSALVFLSSCAVPAVSQASPSPAQFPADSASIPSAPEAVRPARAITATPVPVPTATPTQLPMNYAQYPISDGVPDVNRKALLFVEPGIAALGYVPTTKPGMQFRCPSPDHDGLNTIAYIGENTVIVEKFGERAKYFGLAMMNPKNCRYELVWAAPFSRGTISLTELERDTTMGVYSEPVNGIYGSTKMIVDSKSVIIGCTGKGSRPTVGASVRVGFVILYDKPNGKGETYVQWIAPSTCPLPGQSAPLIQQGTPVPASDQDLKNFDLTATAVFAKP